MPDPIPHEDARQLLDALRTNIGPGAHARLTRYVEQQAALTAAESPQDLITLGEELAYLVKAEGDRRDGLCIRPFAAATVEAADRLLERGKGQR